VSGRGRNPTAVEQLDADGNVIATYSGAKAAARALNVSYSGIAKVCSGKHATICGMRFRYADVPSEPTPPVPSGRHYKRVDRSTYVLYQGDEVIGIGSINELASRFDIPPDTIRC